MLSKQAPMNDMGLIGFILILINFVFSYKGFTNQQFFESYKFEVDSILIQRDFTRLLSSGFLHGSWMHLIFNMLSLVAFSQIVETTLGELRFLILYFTSLIGGNLLSLYVHRHHGDYSAVGASGAVCGVIFACIALYPGFGVGSFFLPFHLPSWLYGVLYVFISMYGTKSQNGNTAHEAHLGGALIGMLTAIIMQPAALRENLFTILIIAVPVLAFIFVLIVKPHFLLLDSFSSRKSTNYYDVDHKYNEDRANRQHEMDKLLDKIKTKGMSSLTQKEKDRLEELSKKTR